MARVPDFLWSDDDQVTEDALRRHLASDDAEERALWTGRVMREARYAQVWDYVALPAVLRDWERIVRHLGRRRGMWEFLLQQWRAHGYIASGPDRKSATPSPPP